MRRATWIAFALGFLAGSASPAGALPVGSSAVGAGEGPSPLAASLPVGAQSADSLIAAAQAAARAGRSHEAIRDYELALYLDPRRRSEVTGPLAFQYAWVGDLQRARREFDRALAARPDDYDLRMGRLLVTNWMGDHLSAWSGYSRLAGEYPDRTGPWTGLAAAQNWSGRRDLALDSVSRARRLDSGDRDAVGLDRTLRTGLRPVVGAFYDWSEDSDDYQINSGWLEGLVSPHPQLQVAPFVNQVGIRRPASPAIDETWVGLTAAARPATRWGLWGRISILTNPDEPSAYQPVTGSLTADVTVHDRLRGGAGFERFATVAYPVLPEKVTGESYSLYVEGRPDWLSRARLTAAFAHYDPVLGFEANRRWSAALEASRQFWAPARLRLGVSGRTLDFEKYQNVGIWNPDWFWALAGTVELELGDRETWSVTALAEVGPAREAGTDETTLFATYRVGFLRTLGPVLLDANIGHTEGNVETGTGFDRTFAHLGLRKRF
jgi:tetratricopeptide (TPR) repeat protein